MSLNRRRLLIGAGAGGALVVAWALTPRRFASPLTPHEGESAFGAWLMIARDGTVSVAVPQLEMGQGITTVLPQLAALELGADWNQVRALPVQLSGAYPNTPLAARWAELWMPFAPALAQGDDPMLARRFAQRNRFAATAEGTGLEAYAEPIRQVAAGARAALIAAAAGRWGVDASACRTENHFVIAGDRRLPFGALAAEAAESAVEGAGTTPIPRDGPVIGMAPTPRFPRLDGPAKASGAALFAGDVRLPGMLHAAIAFGPVGEARLVGHDAAAAKALPGGARLIEGPGWLAAVADSRWLADRALAAAAPQFAVAHAPESRAIDAALDRAVRKGRTERIATIGDPDDSDAKWSLAARFDLSPALAAPLEPAACTARLADGRLELWVASQAPAATAAAAARAVGIGSRKVAVYPLFAGGGFDARLECDHAVAAALLAQKTGKAVQLTLSRWQDLLTTRPRAPAAAVLAARIAPSGEITHWKARIATPASAREFGARLFGGKTPREAIRASTGEADPLALAGALTPYAIPNLALDHVPVAIDLPTGRVRGNAHVLTAFTGECFVDELARANKREPLSYRMAMLSHDVRLAQLLQRVAALAKWDAGNGASGQGLACWRIGEGRIAVIVTAKSDAQGLRVEKITAAVDIGRNVNLDIARQQIEGGLVFGLGNALGASTGYVGGLPAIGGRIGALGLPTLTTTPQIEVEFADSEAPAADPGELGVAVLAPALANALFSATGTRIRRLPLLSEDA